MTGRVLLRSYLRKQQVSRSRFAGLLPVSRSLVTMWLAGERRPGLENAARIERVTAGSVPSDAWLPAALRRAA